MEIPELYKLFLSHGKISTDTRRIEPGSIFFALKGENFDGSDFIKEALSKGAAWAVTQSGTVTGEKIIRVDDTLTALQQLATYHRITSGIKILAITDQTAKHYKGIMQSSSFKKIQSLCH
jgi:UDP-N-acetylmuramoyl-tripeptide--D-alanyl-D-alanine ligase